VVAEDGVAAGQPCEELAQAGLGPRPREEVSAHEDEVGLPLLRPRDRALDRLRPARRNSEVKVRQVCDAKAGELLVEARNRDLENAEPYPARLEVAPSEGTPGRSSSEEAFYQKPSRAWGDGEARLGPARPGAGQEREVRPLISRRRARPARCAA
jgi:hypothetical protein